jgi:MFS family permease
VSLRKTLKYSIIDGSFYSLTVGLGESYFAAFALALGTTDTYAGLISVVPLLIGSFGQIFVPFAVQHIKSYRKWVCIMALLQSLSLILLASVAATFSKVSGTLLFFAITFYWVTSMATNPAWNSWMGAFVPSVVRIRFFAHRNRLLQLFTLFGILGAGYFLQATKDRPDHLAFAVLFVLAGFCRLISTIYLFRSHEPAEIALNIHALSLRTQIKHLRNSPTGKLFLYLLTLHFTTNVASPYFAPYMLSELKLNYHQFALLTAAAMIAKFLSLPLWGKRAVRHSVPKLLSIGTLGIVLIPWLWINSTNFYFLIFLQVFGGIFWAAQELGTFLIFFEHLEPKTRASFLALFSLLNNSGVVIGSLMGGIFLRTFGENRNGYVMVFIVSGLLRLIPLAMMPTCLNLPRKKTRLFPLFSAMVKPHFLKNRRKHVPTDATNTEHSDHRARRPWQDNAS